MRVNVYPRVLVSDRDIAFINAMNVVLPEACNMLCHFHIDNKCGNKV